MDPRPQTKCNRRTCRKAYREHTGVSRSCPDGSGRVFAHHKPPSDRVSQSFSTDEVRLLSEAVSQLLRGGDLRVLARHKAFPALARKVDAMKRAAVSRETERCSG